ncbi:hypothetical protein [Stenotrophomonas sp. 24(2023)]|uniref:hypothetical protein n=1 Tax=Stenotrophomonas sp. 24(2023) TaxID=3068324 RepID=UPI0027DFFB91|nr:hypothetical protein [Stenotrophomonas sp. 24(2023)]WMJ68089.1 hypothetical protein Q9R17_12865 [Stenotrophomonas sp. 24(2023)]
MGVEYSPLSLDAFLRGRKAVHAEGVCARVHMGQLLVGLTWDLLGKAESVHGGAASLMRGERELYGPIVDRLRAALPGPISIDIEATLPLISTEAQPLRTDISVRMPGCHRQGKAAKTPQAMFIEVKSAFAGERLREADVCHDLAKLARCRAAYGAQCFFMIVGLADSLRRGAVGRLLGLATPSAMLRIELEGIGPVWLQLTASNTVGAIHSHVWLVSTTASLPADAGYYRYSLFQHLMG